RIVNLAEWKTHVVERLRRQVDTSADPVLAALLQELRGYPDPAGADAGPVRRDRSYEGVVVPIELRTPAGVLAFFSTTTVFGTPVDITLSELAVESFFPADEATSQALRSGLVE
ncbi:MAG TPA: hypothetical protein VD833_16730, partial [Vicinamibacterales bacterium]|nr:hypothetical protein [Vicinamibacterales bacterium]